jgi:hypothetical protein
MMDDKASGRSWENEMPLPILRIIDAAQDSHLPGSAINLFTLVALRADEQGETVVTLREMAEQMGTGINTVSRGFSTLEQGGYIRRKARSRVGDSTHLIVLPRASR